MHRASHHRSPLRPATRILLLLALAATSLALTHCRNVGDRLTGVDVGAFKRPDSCFDACYDGYRQQVKAESDLHVQLVKNCAGDEACLDEEGARHEAALENIQTERISCLNRCHQQGGGTGGQ